MWFIKPILLEPPVHGRSRNAQYFGHPFFLIMRADRYVFNMLALYLMERLDHQVELFPFTIPLQAKRFGEKNILLI